MALETGGRASKIGNMYEYEVLIFYFIKIIKEEIKKLYIEPIGEDERGVDIVIYENNKSKKLIQCKSRNGSLEYWNYSGFNAYNIFDNWRRHLDNDINNHVALFSPLSFTLLDDIIYRVKTNDGDIELFYKYQILKSGKSTVNLFENICSKYNLNCSNTDDLRLIYDYLNRMEIIQIGERSLKEIININIDNLFLGDSVSVYNGLLKIATDPKIFGNQINQIELRRLLSENNLILNEIDMNTIYPVIKGLNQKFLERYKQIDNKLIVRNEFTDCRNHIKSNNSFIIHGKAGIGKSGCSVDVVNYCNENNIMCVPINLDSDIPTKNLRQWSESLGFPTTIPSTINRINDDQKAVIVLDQLDSLRWTSNNSNKSLEICSNLIEEVKVINKTRKEKIIIIFACRTYDFNNDTYIKMLFEKDDWKEVEVKSLSTNDLYKIIGKEKTRLNKKTLELIRIPQNLYIWKKLDEQYKSRVIHTSYDLIKLWWIQIQKNYSELNEPKNLVKAVNKIFKNLLEQDKSFVHVLKLAGYNEEIEYLTSNNFINNYNDKIRFTHQSILDFWRANELIIKTQDGENIIDLIGSKEKQNLNSRYHLQMFLEYMNEYDYSEFLDLGYKIFNSCKVRFFNKYLFLEILSSNIKNNSDTLYYFNQILSSHKNRLHFINSVLYGNKRNFNIFKKTEYYEEFISEKKNKYLLLNLLISFRDEIDLSDLNLIENIGLTDFETASNFVRVFNTNLEKDSLEMFELRLKFYERYPSLTSRYIDLKKSLYFDPYKTSLLFINVLDNDNMEYFKKQNSYVNCYEKNLDISLQCSAKIFTQLLKSLPKGKITQLSPWSEKQFGQTIERTIIDFVTILGNKISEKSPETYIEIYEEYYNEDNDLHNEIFMNALKYISHTYSDFVIEKIINSIESSSFDTTSSNKNNLQILKNLLKTNSTHCNNHLFDKLENTIYSYTPPNMVEKYKYKIETQRRYPEINIHYWGELQFELLPCLDSNRIKKHTQSLINILIRKFSKDRTSFEIYSSNVGSVKSPIYDVSLTPQQWVSIMLNPKIKEDRNIIKNKSGYIDNSINQYAREFSTRVSNSPEEFIKHFINLDIKIPDLYIDSLFSGLAYSENLNNVDGNLINNIIEKFGANLESSRGTYISTIIDKHEHNGWSQKVIDLLIDLLINHKDPIKDNMNVKIRNKDEQSSEVLWANIINSTRSNLLLTVGNLINKDSIWMLKFKDTISALSDDANMLVNMATTYPLFKAFSTDENWASKILFNLFETNILNLGLFYSRYIMFMLYEKDNERTKKIILNGLSSNDTGVKIKSIETIAEMNIVFDEFPEILSDYIIWNKEESNAIIHICKLYFESGNKSEKAESIVLDLASSEENLSHSLTSLFSNNTIELPKHEKFLRKLLKTNNGMHLMNSFVRLLHESNKSIDYYFDEIVTLAKTVIIEIEEDSPNNFFYIDDLSKVLIKLYEVVIEIDNYRTNEVLDLIDKMYEIGLGWTRSLVSDLLDN